MNHRIVTPAVIAALLLSGCAAKPTTSTTKDLPSHQQTRSLPRSSKSLTAAQEAPCESQGTVYVLPVGSGAAMDGSSEWMKLTMGATNEGSVASIETVIPSSPTWHVVRLTVPASDADAAGALVGNDQAIQAMGTPIVSANACFTGWNAARLSHFAQVDEAVWLAADRIANGMDFFGPQVVQSGQKIYVIVEQGSVDGDTIRQGTTAGTSWFAVNTATHQKQFAVSLDGTAQVGTRMLAEFVVPANAATGTYVLAVSGGSYPTYSSDFVFEVH